MTHRQSKQPWDTHSLQPPTIQANSMNTGEYLMTYTELHHVNNEEREEKDCKRL